MSNNRQTLKTIISSFTLKKERLANDIKKLENDSRKKQDSVNKFKSYIKEYQDKIFSHHAISGSTLINHQFFLDKLTTAMHKEEDILTNLNDQQQQLIQQHNQLTIKIDGLTERLSNIEKNFALSLATKMDNEINELAVTREMLNQE